MKRKSSSNRQENSKTGFLKVAVLCGGVGDERQISLESGRCVYKALQAASVNAVLADIGPDNLSILDDGSIDVFFVAMHGRFGEDGQLQEIVDNKGLVYTGSSAQSCRISFDKAASKRAFTQAAVKVPAWVEYRPDEDEKGLEQKIEQLGGKYVVKPLRQGSSVGISISENSRQALLAANETYEKFGDCMIEEFIAGREFTVGIVCGKTLPLIEIRPKQAFYDYYAKYSDKRTEFIFDSLRDKTLIAQMEQAALKCNDALGMRDIARVDFIVNEQKQSFALEINAIPGMTSHSLVPMAAAHEGVSMSQLCMEIIDSALKRKKREPSVSFRLPSGK